MTRTIDDALGRFDLIAGAGSEESKKACAMTLLAWVAGREWSDSPPCAHHVIRRAVISVNDASGTSAEMREAIVRAGETGILDTWWIPTQVVALAFALESKDEQITPYKRLLRALHRISEWKSEKGLPPSLAGAYLAGADLAGAYLTGADLAGAYLARASLAGASLAGAYLARASLAGAYLAGADLAGADLTGADLTGAYGKPLGGMPDGWKLNDSGLWVRS